MLYVNNNGNSNNNVNILTLFMFRSAECNVDGPTGANNGKAGR